MSRPPAPLLLPGDPVVFTAAEALGHGISRSRLRRADLESLGTGIHRLSGSRPTERDLAAAMCRQDPSVVVHRVSAARFWRFPLAGRQAVPAEIRPGEKGTPRFATADPHSQGMVRIEVRRLLQLAGPGRKRRHTSLIRWSPASIPLDERVRIGDLQVTTRIRTLRDLAPILTMDELVMIGDHLVRRPRPDLEGGRDEPYASISQLVSMADSYEGRGALALREAMRLIRTSSDSPAETQLRLAAVRGGLPEPLANAPVRIGSVNLGEPDLLWREWKVMAEHEGPRHRTPQQQAKDIARTEKRVNAGWTEVRTTAPDLRNDCARGVHRIREALRNHGWQG
jgi:hypothetical protein